MRERAVDKLPTWVKVVGGVLLTAALFGAARLLLWLDQLGAAKVGVD